MKLRSPPTVWSMAQGVEAPALYHIALSCDFEGDVWQHIGMCYFGGCLKPDGREKGGGRERKREYDSGTSFPALTYGDRGDLGVKIQHSVTVHID